MKLRMTLVLMILGLAGWFGFVMSGGKPAVAAPAAKMPAAHGWLQWRGEGQNGVSLETGLVDKWALNGENDLWSLKLMGRGAPVAAGDRVYVFGYRGEGADLQEVLSCIQADTGKIIWEKGFNDFLSDVVYDRYSIGAPVIDAETGNIYLQTTPGEIYCFTPEGKQVWRHSMMERFGQLTFPNGRIGSPVIDDDLLIVHGITSYWGKDGPAADRYFAFDKKTGALVWHSTPGLVPKDSSFATPVLRTESDGRRVIYTATGCGHAAAMDARTGQPLWRYLMAVGGLNSSVLVFEDMVIAVHGRENLDSSKAGRMVAIRRGAVPAAGSEEPVELPKSYEVWRNSEICMFSSSPVLVGERIYQVDEKGELFCVNARTGKTMWKKKLAVDQIHASPLWADGKLYLPMNNGLFYILKPNDAGAEELAKVQLEGNALGSPAIWNGKIYVHTTEKLYCFGKKGDNPGAPGSKPLPEKPAAGKPTQLQVVPADVMVFPGQTQKFEVRMLDALGRVTGVATDAKFEKFIPPTARVKTMIDGEFNAKGELVIGAAAKESAGAIRVTTKDGLVGYSRGRVMRKPPFAEDFESYPMAEKHADGEEDAGLTFGYPPLPWTGARFRWELHEHEGNKVLAKAFISPIFQRAQTLIGDPEMTNYTMEADVKTDGNRRGAGEVGLINQRYIFALKGNHGELEINSNHERVKHAVKYNIKPKTWYHMKTRVDVAADGSGVARAKVWERGAPEPEAWTLEYKHKNAHKQGAPGLFAFSPQKSYRVYIDNLKVTPN